jgi:hypothetical protein
LLNTLDEKRQSIGCDRALVVWSQLALWRSHEMMQQAVPTAPVGNWIKEIEG